MPTLADQPLPLWLIIGSFLLAMLMTILPLPSALVLLNPSWVLLVLIYWILMRPYQCNIGWAFFIGLSLDLLNGNVLGQHALLFVLISYILVTFQKRIILFPLIQQTALIIALCFIEKIGIFIVQWIVGHTIYSTLFWFAPLLSGLCWLWFGLLSGSLKNIT